MLQMKNLLIIGVLLVGVLVYQYTKNEDLPKPLTTEISPSQMGQNQSSQQGITKPSLEKPAQSEQSNSASVVLTQTQKMQRPIEVKPSPRPEMLNFQKDPEFIAFIKKMEESLKSSISNPSLRSKVSQHLTSHLNQPVNFDKPSPPKKLELSKLELLELKEVVQQNKALLKTDPQTHQQLLNLAVEADPTPAGKAETLGSSLQIVAEKPEEVFFNLQNMLMTAQVYGIPADLLIPQLEKSLSLQKDERTREVLQNSLKDLRK